VGTAAPAVRRAKLDCSLMLVIFTSLREIQKIAKQRAGAHAFDLLAAATPRGTRKTNLHRKGWASLTYEPCTVSLNTEPVLFTPPFEVVPYRFPALSITTSVLIVIPSGAVKMVVTSPEGVVF
jgi:hypothetical protein